ncbi:hypothetical protein HY439_00720 [Candidatus Microgenomates bacterium]|nr:hypothetical protein [Candidatus Microgenomates bacterium]
MLAASFVGSFLLLAGLLMVNTGTAFFWYHERDLGEKALLLGLISVLFGAVFPIVIVMAGLEVDMIMKAVLSLLVIEIMVLGPVGSAWLVIQAKGRKK